MLLPALLIFITEPRRQSVQERAEARAGAAPMLTLPLAAVLLAAILNSVAFYLMPTQLPFHLKSMGVNAPVLAGAALGLMTLASATVSFFYGRVRSVLGVASAFALGFGISGTGLLLVGVATSFIAILPAALIVGCGLGIIMPTLGAAAMGLAADHNRGRVAGLLTASIFLGQFASPFASQPLAAGGSYAAAFGVGAAAVTAAALIALAVATGGRKRQVA
jgi:MFS family permease